ncbi:MAG: hypothetical protein WAT41_10420 [Flavobacteriales bacterium]
MKGTFLNELCYQLNFLLSKVLTWYASTDALYSMTWQGAAIKSISLWGIGLPERA